MHRPTIGLIAIVLLVVGWYTHSQSDQALSAACLRIGAVMCILWFAQPQLPNLPRWMVAAGAIGLFIIVRWPKFIIYAIPLFAVLWVLRPRAPKVGQ